MSRHMPPSSCPPQRSLRPWAVPHAHSCGIRVTPCCSAVLSEVLFQQSAFPDSRPPCSLSFPLCLSLGRYEDHGDVIALQYVHSSNRL